MATYAIVNEKRRIEFEKKWQMPYGYLDCPKFSDFDSAIIEEYDCGRRRIVHSIWREQDED